MSDAKIRLYVDQPLGQGQPVPLTQDQAHYLFGVMRLGPGACVLVFNGRDGEWRADVAEVGKRGGTLVCAAQTAPLRLPPDLWLMFAPIKKARTDFIVEKAAEMGAARILPVQTRFTNSERIRQDRLQAHAVEAAEQCGGTFVPEVADLVPLDRLLDRWPADRRIMWCDETLLGARAGLLEGAGQGPARGFEEEPKRPSPGPWAILIGPEGGFSEAEQDRLRRMPQVVPVSLGPRILRADTAAVAALALWQSVLGDWV
ncbi:16S rRNA (uracil(1498)-N(3))-methyltransferase [Cereibacter sphaeroides]|uniref:16S rRNA (uracil(1498)-N(3))-methyltransferase n=1 Tax=Cereibacter sphaeroides TaxID=1063 RepID=UPI001F1661CC|nr:16S rRNA (uracil(1498)-N(3))-methyltransferase [Cereibacter sphaeroides]MCE6951193.1 16S rRNA (uracil(1498)-N(3))-methyltransferase [Cereibacter sphaeroides]